jgi:hypothetical protein
MNRVVMQLRAWWFLEAGVRLTWGLSRWLALALSVLAVFCLADWVYDLYAETPFWARAAALVFQVVLAAGSAYLLVVRPLRRAPSYDDLATRAERAIPEFGHRLVTALQLNRPGAKTAGMSRALIAEVTREANEMASRHRLASLANFRPLTWSAVVLGPVLLAAGVAFLVNASLMIVLLKRQVLLDVEIPRSVQLQNATKDVWPTGSEVEVRIRVTGAWSDGLVGKLRVEPEGQPVDTYPLKFDRQNADGSADFVAKLPPSSTPFTFRAWLKDGRTRTPGRVDFESPPQAKDIEAWQLLPTYLGKRADGSSFERQNDGGLRGEVVDALPLSGVKVVARFTKPVAKAELVPIERGASNNDVPRQPVQPDELTEDGLTAEWVFPTFASLIAYRLDLTDRRGFTNPAPIRRGVKMWVDQPPEVERMPESTRHPDPNDYYGGGDVQIYQIDMPLSPGGKVMVNYHARSPLGIGEVSLAYRVIPKGQDPDSAHPRDDPFNRVFVRTPPLTFPEPLRPKLPALGRFVPDLGIFERSFDGRDEWEAGELGRDRVQVPFYGLPARNPAEEPGDLEAGGRVYLAIGDPKDPERSGLKLPGGEKYSLQVGDTIEIYVEATDKYELSRRAAAKRTILPNPRSAGYPREAIRKTVLDNERNPRTNEPSEAWWRTHQRKVTQSRLKDKLDALKAEQDEIFNPTPPMKKK